MRGFSKMAKILLAILLVMLLAAAGLFINSLVKGEPQMVALAAIIVAVLGIGYTIHTAIKERNAREKEDEEDSADDESDYNDVTDY